MVREERTMSETREIYASPNGDRWYLARSSDQHHVFVHHVANAAAGGRETHLRLGDFLARPGNSPEQQALSRLIGTLVEGRTDADS
jgi:hypothetical protein